MESSHVSRWTNCATTWVVGVDRFSIKLDFRADKRVLIVRSDGKRVTVVSEGWARGTALRAFEPVVLALGLVSPGVATRDSDGRHPLFASTRSSFMRVKTRPRSRGRCGTDCAPTAMRRGSIV